MPNGDPDWGVTELPKLERFFAALADEIHQFALKYNMQIDRYYHQASDWRLQFTPPQGGYASIDIRRLTDDTLKVIEIWWIDDYHATTRSVRFGESPEYRVGEIRLSDVLLKALGEILEWRPEELSGAEGIGWWHSYSREEFEKMSPCWPTVRLPESARELTWTWNSQQVDSSEVLRFEILRNAHPISFADAIRGWRDDPEFREFFIRLLANVSFLPFRWETPPVTTATRERPFEFVLIDSPSLETRSDEHAFAEHFHSAGHKDAVEFPNLGHDAILVVPTPKTSPSAYNHLANFVRHAPDSQKHALWQLVGSAMTRRLSERPVWLSTAGAGVSWLHIRLDDKPKYYAYSPYRDPPRQTE